MEQYTTGEVTRGRVTVHGQLVIVKVVAWKIASISARSYVKSAFGLVHTSVMVYVWLLWTIEVASGQ